MDITAIHPKCNSYVGRAYKERGRHAIRNGVSGDEQ